MSARDDILAALAALVERARQQAPEVLPELAPALARLLGEVHREAGERPIAVLGRVVGHPVRATNRLQRPRHLGAHGPGAHDELHPPRLPADRPRVARCPRGLRLFRFRAPQRQHHRCQARAPSRLGRGEQQPPSRPVPRAQLTPLPQVEPEVQPAGGALKSDLVKIGKTMSGEWTKAAGAEGAAIVDAYKAMK